MRSIRSAFVLVAVMTFILGVVYPLFITALGRIAFPRQSQGSLVYDGKTLVGSRLIGQQFSNPKYFWGRPSATAPQPYNGEASGGSNLGPLNPALLAQVDAHVNAIKMAQPSDHTPVPVELVTASASGLDPDLSIAAAQFQVARIAAARHVSPLRVQALIDKLQRRPLFGIIGESQINVLELNMALDRTRE